MVDNGPAPETRRATASLGRSGQCMKTSLICINVITFIGGVLVMGIGLWVWSSRSYSRTLTNNGVITATIEVVVALGAAMVLLSLLGCFGAVKEVRCLLLTYFIIVLIIFVGFFVGGILQLQFRNEVLTNLEQKMFASMRYYGLKRDYTQAWDDTQAYMRCCGVYHYKDWNGKIPESCCQEINSGQRHDCTSSPNPTNIYTNGCYKMVGDYLLDDAAYLGAAAMVIAVIMLLGLILSCGLYVTIKRS